MGEFPFAELEHQTSGFIGAGFHLRPDRVNAVGERLPPGEGHQRELNDVDADVHQSAAADRFVFHALAMVNRLAEFHRHSDHLDDAVS